MTGRSTPISVYVTEERKAELEDRADARDDSVSGIVNEMIERQLQADAQEAVATETRAEERIQELISLGVEELTEVAEDLRERQARAGAHAIATFELQKRGVAEPVRREALVTGTRRIRGDESEPDGDLQDVVVGGGEAEGGGSPGDDAVPPSPEAAESQPDSRGDPAQPDDPEHPNQAADLFDRLRSDRS